jgi:hypothetical protein
MAWSPRLSIAYDYASGDRDPGDDDQGRFDTLFGARRFEFGPTGIYGAFARSNLSSPGIGGEVRPRGDVRTTVFYRAAWLASARDAWTTSGLRDTSGESGTFIGHQIEGSVRWSILPDRANIEGGFAYLRLGQFPRAQGAASNPLYIYVQVRVEG